MVLPPACGQTLREAAAAGRESSLHSSFMSLQRTLLTRKQKTPSLLQGPGPAPRHPRAALGREELEFKALLQRRLGAVDPGVSW